MRNSFFSYLSAAFSARPLGMWVPPNWVGLAAIGILGTINPGFLIIGAGVELAYLVTLAGNGRFQRWVDAMKMGESQQDWISKKNRMLQNLDRDARIRYLNLETRCQMILQRQQSMAQADQSWADPSQSLSKLLWVHLQLLLTQQAIARVLLASRENSEPLDRRIDRLDKQLADTTLEAELRVSLEGQRDILVKRQTVLDEAYSKAQLLASELQRIEDQVELIREQSVASPNTASLAGSIDEIAGTLGTTTQWMANQQISGGLDDVSQGPPADWLQPTQQSQ